MPISTICRWPCASSPTVRRAISPKPTSSITRCTSAGAAGPAVRPARREPQVLLTVNPFITDGTCVLMPTPMRTISCGLHPHHVGAADQYAPVGWSSRYCPVRHLKNVLLPAPLGPMQAAQLALLEREVDAIHGRHAAEAYGQIDGLDHCVAHGRPVAVPWAGPRSGWRQPRNPLRGALARGRARVPRATRGSASARATALQRRHHSARDREHDDHQHEAQQQRIVDQRLLAQQELDHAERHGAEDRADQRPTPADDDPDDHLRSGRG